MPYSKEFLIDAFLWRYEMSGFNTRRLAQIAEDTWNMCTSKDKFREYCSLDAKAIREYSNWLEECGYARTY